VLSCLQIMFVYWTFDLEFSALSFSSHHDDSSPANDAPFLPPPLDRENNDTDMPSDSDSPIENEAALKVHLYYTSLTTLTLRF